uniref:Hexosyltransferase n=1 Tax=Latimeria chalumnae TaxID=7897 RepID=H3B2U6_LATCH
TMKLHLKGDAICTLLLTITFCALLYFHLKIPSGPSWQSLQTHKKKPLDKIRLFTEAEVLEDRLSQVLDTPICQPNLKVLGSDLQTSTLSATMTPPSFNFRQYLRNKDCRDFKLIINQPNKCKKAQGDLFLLIAIKSVVEEFERREVVRKTWGKEGLLNGVQIQSLFLLGIPKNQTALPLWKSLMNYESQTYGDILMWDFLDTFFNLTLKEINFLKWASTFCPNTKFVFKGDTDIFVNMENIVDFLSGQNPVEDFFLGQAIFYAQPIRLKKSKYFIPEMMFGQPAYPTYVGGGGFLMSGYTMKRLYQACQQVELFPIDDVFLGMCLLRLGLQPVSHDGFRTFGIPRPSAAPHMHTFDPCFYKDLMVVHGLKPAEIWLMWNLLRDPGLTCTRKKLVSRPFRWKTSNRSKETVMQQDIIEH